MRDPGEKSEQQKAAIDGLITQLKVFRGEFTSAEDEARKAWEERKNAAGADDEGTIAALNNLGTVTAMKGDALGALNIYQQAIFAITDKTRNAASLQDELIYNAAVALMTLNDLKQAYDLLTKVVEYRTRKLGPDHPETLEAETNLATVLGNAGYHSPASELHASIAERLAKTLGDLHPNTLRSRSLAASQLGHICPTPATRSQLSEVLSLEEKILGAENDQTLTTALELGRQAYLMHDLDTAENMERRVSMHEYDCSAQPTRVPCWPWIIWPERWRRAKNCLMLLSFTKRLLMVGGISSG